MLVKKPDHHFEALRTWKKKQNKMKSKQHNRLYRSQVGRYMYKNEQKWKKQKNKSKANEHIFITFPV